jgi:hypothetical protein
MRMSLDGGEEIRVPGSPDIRTFVTFQTQRFNTTEVLPHFINPCCFGEDCATWLTSTLRAEGWAELSPPWQEDWGWQAGGERRGRKYLVSVGLLDGPDEPGEAAAPAPARQSTPDEWLVQLTESAGLLARLRGAVGAPVLPDLARTVHRVLQDAPHVQSIRWHFADQFDRGPSAGTFDPEAPRGIGEAAV